MHSTYIHKHHRPPRNLRYTCQALVHRLVAASKMDLILKALNESIQLAIKIKEAVDKMRFGDDLRCKIRQRIKDIQSLLDQWLHHSDPNVIKQMKDTIYNTQNQLQSCLVECDKLSNQHVVMRIKNSDENSIELLKHLYSELSHIHDNLSGHGICAISEQVSALHSDVKDASLDPKAGFYFVRSSSCIKKPPCKVDKPEVEMRGAEVHIKWKDDRNSPRDLEKYEIHIDGYPHLITTKQTERKAAIIEPERMKLTPGNLYTFTIRAVNEKGPGEWSDSTAMRLKTGRLDAPKKPNVISDYRSIKVEVDIPQTYGRHVNKVVCQYHEYDSGGQWISESFLTEEVEGPTSMTFETNCSSFIRYHLRVLLVNECGDGLPSDTVDVLPVPGQLENVRQSSNYTSSMIKLRWNPPMKNKEFVDHYQIKYKRIKHLWKDDKPFYVFETKSKDKLSAKIDKLKSDTEYVFDVSAVNEKGVSGEALRLIAETKWKKITKAALSPLVFLGTTAAAPLMSVVGGALGAGLLAADSIDSEAGAVAGAVGAGIGGGIGGAVVGTVGAPIVGGMMAHLFVHGLGPDSEQSDDD